VDLPGSAAWKEDFVAELVQFTGVEGEDAADDQVDCLAYAVQHMDRCAPFAPPAAIPNPLRRDPFRGRGNRAAYRRLAERMIRGRGY
jgi:hypothetical protein